MNLDPLPPDLRKRFLEAESAAKNKRYLTTAERAEAFAKTTQLQAEVQALADNANVTEIFKSIVQRPRSTRDAIHARFAPTA
jgi:hypothetical protein